MPIVFPNLRIQNPEIIADLQDAGKSPDEKQRFTIRRLILIIEDKRDINNFVGKGSRPQVVLLYDSCIISLNYVVLRSDDLQLTYKKSCSTIQCVSMVTEVINYYRNNGGSVYMCMLDASKAFGRVNLLTLFKTLYSRGMFPIYLRLLMKIYE